MLPHGLPLTRTDQEAACVSLQGTSRAEQSVSTTYTPQPAGDAQTVDVLNLCILLAQFIVSCVLLCTCMHIVIANMNKYTLV